MFRADSLDAIFEFFGPIGAVEFAQYFRGVCQDRQQVRMVFAEAIFGQLERTLQILRSGRVSALLLVEGTEVVQWADKMWVRWSENGF
jgi:hypothetical protein